MDTAKMNYLVDFVTTNAGDEGHTNMVAAVIASLAQYLADFVEGS